MVTVPDDTAVTTPVVASIVATVVLLLVQLPPVTASLSVTEPQTNAAPAIGPGSAFTVTSTLAMQPVLVVYLIVAIPGDTPLTVPLAISTVATETERLLHVPPVVALPSMVVLPWQTAGVPV